MGGDRLLDVGCGYGDWLVYARSKGMKVMGINISPDQAYYARTHYGLQIINENWKDVRTNATLQNTHFGTFDAVTFMDTAEHYLSNVNVLKRQGSDPSEEDCEDAHSVYYDMFDFANKMIDRQSPRKRVFLSMLHSARTLHLSELVYGVVLTRFHSGHYPAACSNHCISGCQTSDFDEEKLGQAPQQYGIAKYATRHFRLLKIEDVTEDYRLTAVKSPHHFQSPDLQYTSAKVWRLAGMFFQDPFFLHKVLEWRWDMWMKLYGSDYTSKNYDREYRKQESAQLCYWMTFEAN